MEHFIVESKIKPELKKNKNKMKLKTDNFRLNYKANYLKKKKNFDYNVY